MAYNYWIRGDTHGDFAFLKEGHYTKDDIIIILGDTGLNFFGGMRDIALKNSIKNFPCTILALRGNHDRRPQDVDGMQLAYDERAGGEVYFETDFPNILYFKDYGEYNLNGYKCLAIGGAYSVDKHYRLKNGWTWYDNEQLSDQEMKMCFEMVKGKNYDFIFSHTCPKKWAPVDLFLSQVNENSVDYSMELWLNDIEENVNWFCWCFGHYHRDRLERVNVEMMLSNINSLDEVYNKWIDYEKNHEVIAYSNKSPFFYI